MFVQFVHEFLHVWQKIILVRYVHEFLSQIKSNYLYFKTSIPFSENPNCEEIQTEVDSDHPVLDHPVLDHPVLDHPVLDHPVLEHPVLDHPVLDHPVLDNPMMDQPVPISREAPISSSTEATKPSEAFLQTISSGMI